MVQGSFQGAVVHLFKHCSFGTIMGSFRPDFRWNRRYGVYFRNVFMFKRIERENLLADVLSVAIFVDVYTR